MAPKGQQDEEKAILKHISSTFPAFLDGTAFVAADADPPDFVGECEFGSKIGLELTAWLDGGQVNAGQGRQRMRQDLLTTIDWERHPLPHNFAHAVIMPRWGKRIGKAHRQDLCNEFYAVAENMDSDWKALRHGHWKALRPEERFDYEVHQSEINRHPTLSQYVSSIWFAEPIEPNQTFPDECWVSVESDGGFYDPACAIQALRNVIESKVDHYGRQNVKAHLDAQRLHRLYLLVHTDPARFSYNTPYQTCAQMMTSPVEGLTEASRMATHGLSALPKVFDGIFLLYHVWNARWLAQIWPTFRRIPAIDPLDA